MSGSHNSAIASTPRAALCVYSATTSTFSCDIARAVSRHSYRVARGAPALDEERQRARTADTGVTPRQAGDERRLTTLPLVQSDSSGYSRRSAAARASSLLA